MVYGTGLGIETDVTKQGAVKTRKPEKIKLDDFVAKVKGYVKN